MIQQIVAGSNRLVNEASPIADARLADGSRVNVVLPPVAINGPIVTIRKFAKEAITMKKLMEWQSINSEVSGFLALLVAAGYNIFISGGTGSGKTTFLNALSQYIPKNERIITIEDNAELQIQNVKESGKTGSKKCKCRRNRRSYHQGSDQVGTSYETGQDHRGGSALGGSN